MQSKFYYIIFLILIFSCKDNPQEKNGIQVTPEGLRVVKLDTSKSIFTGTFKDINNLKPFENFEKTRGVFINFGKKETQFGIQEIKDNKSTILILERLTYKDVSNPDHKILDTLEFRKLNKSYQLIFKGCYQNDSINERIISIVDTTRKADSNYFQNIKKAWKINLDTKKFEEIKSVENIKCSIMNQDA